ncbi:MAG: universal stress protein [Nitrolancea sp.]
MKSTIVVPLSGSPHDRSRLSERAIPYARSLARRTNSSIVLTSVVDLPDELAAYYALPASDHEKKSGPVAERQEYLGRLAEKFAGLSVRTEVRTGDPAEEVIDLVEHQTNPMLVLASHARTGVGRAILGSVAFSIVHRVNCPVLILPTSSRETPIPIMPERGAILIPLDGSFSSESVLRMPLQVLGDPDYALHLLFVVTPVTDVDGMPIEAFIGPKEEWASDYLQTIAERLTREGYMVTWSVKIGEVPEQIMEVAREIDADVIAMTTHGRHGIGRMLFGSVTERIAHESHLPLLLIHPDSTLVPVNAEDDKESESERRMTKRHIPLGVSND